MSITYRIESAGTEASWPFSSAAGHGINRLVALGYGELLKDVGLSDKAELGRAHVIKREILLGALETLMPIAKTLPKGFQARMRDYLGTSEDGVGRGISGLEIGASMYYVSCQEDYWEIRLMAISSRQPDDPLVPELLDVRRYQPAEFHTKNMGIVSMEVKKGRPEIFGLLCKIQTFVSSSNALEFRVIVG